MLAFSASYQRRMLTSREPYDCCLYCRTETACLGDGRVGAWLLFSLLIVFVPAFAKQPLFYLLLGSAHCASWFCPDGNVITAAAYVRQLSVRDHDQNGTLKFNKPD